MTYVIQIIPHGNYVAKVRDLLSGRAVTAAELKPLRDMLGHTEDVIERRIADVPVFEVSLNYLRMSAFMGVGLLTGREGKAPLEGLWLVQSPYGEGHKGYKRGVVYI